jgi:cytoskeletal protein RodZ
MKQHQHSVYFVDSNMRSLGETIKDARKEKGMSRADLERETKIKKDFLEAIENGAWGRLPEFPVVQGFVRSISHVLEMDEQLVLALLRRDYPKKDVSLAPKPDVRNKFLWSPRWTLFTGALVVALLIVGYLGYQYKQFVSPPTLLVTKPAEGEVLSSAMYKVEGVTNADATISVNNQPALVNDNGNWETEIEISTEMKEITVTATSRSGKVTEIKRKVEVKI